MRLARRLTWMILLASTAAAACGAGCASQVREFLGPDAVAILNAPGKVETFRVVAPLVQSAPQTSGHTPTTAPIAKYPVTAVGPVEDAAFARRLARVFLSADTYAFDAVKACKFRPGVVFRVHSGGGDGRYVDLLLCFHCYEFQFQSRDAAGTLLKEGYEDFAGDSIAELADLAKQAFPNDEEIRALP